VRAHRVEHGAHAIGAHRGDGVGTNLSSERHPGPIEDVSPIILHIDDE
jgi:hypothetical protein